MTCCTGGCATWNCNGPEPIPAKREELPRAWLVRRPYRPTFTHAIVMVLLEPFIVAATLLGGVTAIGWIAITLSSFIGWLT